MVYEKEINGKYVFLRAATIEDAKFTAKLRSDISLIRHIHKVDTSIEGQKKYIQEQRKKDNDYYFIVWSSDNEPLGTIALYNFDGKCAELGRWVSYGNAFQNLESVVILHDFAFNILLLDSVCTCTNVTNNRVINFWKMFGSDELYIEDEIDFTASKNIVSKETYKKIIFPRLKKILRY